MNFLNIRKGPKMNFIIGEHRNAFEEEVIDLYCGEQGGFWDCVPSLDMSIVENISDKYILAGLLGHATGDQSYFIKETAGKMLPEFMDIWCEANLEKLRHEAPGNYLYSVAGTKMDAMEVLNYHHMFYAFRMDNGDYPGTGLQGFRFVPIHEVW
ncbi:hypothetical protein [Priestia megaterium]|uniref:hypothetical protein n=1 Tax=Priestia megaterium TaxID=1404 RepID=UPI000BFB699E|nr:hypothetical protein [Priestia megaterium]PGQ88235.1 hypothetical protein COA18_04730 [Priestia megaterium]